MCGFRCDPPTSASGDLEILVKPDRHVDAFVGFVNGSSVPSDPVSSQSANIYRAIELATALGVGYPGPLPAVTPATKVTPTLLITNQLSSGLRPTFPVCKSFFCHCPVYVGEETKILGGSSTAVAIGIQSSAPNIQPFSVSLKGTIRRKVLAGTLSNSTSRRDPGLGGSRATDTPTGNGRTPSPNGGKVSDPQGPSPVWYLAVPDFRIALKAHIVEDVVSPKCADCARRRMPTLGSRHYVRACACCRLRPIELLCRCSLPFIGLR